MMFSQASKGFKGKMEPQNTVLPEKLQKVGPTFSRVLKAAEGHNFSHSRRDLLLRCKYELPPTGSRDFQLGWGKSGCVAFGDRTWLEEVSY